MTVSASVIIPVLNGETTLGEQLEALTRQSLRQSFEVLVCDNGSTDRTAEVVGGFRDRISNLRVVSAHAKRGPAHARNRGIVESQGEFLAFCDADDVVADDWLEQMVRHAGPGLLLSGANEFGLLNPALGGRDSMLDNGLILREGYLYGVDTANLGIMRADALALGGFDESCRYVEDVDFAWRAQQAGDKVIAVPATVHTRLRSSSRGVFRQYRRWGRYSILLRARNAHLHPMPMSFKYTATTLAREVLRTPVIWPWLRTHQRQRAAQTVGALLGEFEPHLRYRTFDA